MSVSMSKYVASCYAKGKDYTKQWEEKDPVLFPLEASDQILRQWPPFITLSAEYDIYEASIVAFYPRLQKAGRLVDNKCYHGCNHGFHLIPKYKRNEEYWADMKNILKQYVQ